MLNRSCFLRPILALETLSLAFALIVSAASLLSQTPATATPASAIPAAAVPTLELPVLVVDHQHRPVDDVTLGQLKIKTGAGAPFAPLSMRLQGVDPLSLGILIDASRDSFHDLTKLDGDLAGLVGSQLLPTDRITMYAIDCAMTRSLNGVAPEPAVLRKGVADALGAPTLHNGQSHSSCGKTVHLWDDIATAVAGLSHAPGRKVLLLISSGNDGGSKYDWIAVQQYAFDQGVAIFALRDQRQAQADDYTRNSMTTTHGTPGATSTFTPPPAARSANNMELLCANDGGLTLSSSPEFRRDGLADILFLIRNRLILTIPKDAYQPGTAHSAKITRTGLNPYFFSATGAAEPLASK